VIRTNVTQASSTATGQATSGGQRSPDRPKGSHRTDKRGKIVRCRIRESSWSSRPSRPAVSCGTRARTGRADRRERPRAGVRQGPSSTFHESPEGVAAAAPGLDCSRPKALASDVMATQQTATVNITNSSGGNASILLFHNNSSNGTQRGSWTAAPRQAVGPLTLRDRLGHLGHPRLLVGADTRSGRLGAWSVHQQWHGRRSVLEGVPASEHGRRQDAHPCGEHDRI
jgi:hypothetical protein